LRATLVNKESEKDSMTALIYLVTIIFCIGIAIVGKEAITHYSECKTDLKDWNNLYEYIFNPSDKIDLEKYPTQLEFRNAIKDTPQEQRNNHINRVITRKYKYNIDKKLLKAQSCMEQLPNLGLLGTVLGLVIGYWFFDGKNMDIIVSCFQTALLTTLVGLGCMIIIKIKGIDSDAEIEYERFLGYVKHLSTFSENNSCVIPNSHPLFK